MGFKAVTTLQPRLPSQRDAGRSAAPTAVCVGLVLALGWQQANAATMGNVVTSLGFFVALAALLVSQALPAQLATDALPMLGVALLLSAGAAVLWRLRRAPFVGGLWSLAPRAVRVPAKSVVPAVAVALPAGFDHDTLLGELRHQFITLQAAWDGREVEVLRALTTPDMLSELCAELPDCHGAPNRTEVITLHARLLGFDEVGAAYLASVEFSGIIRECEEAGAVPFRELWMLARPKHEAEGWRLARQLDLP
ncbi:MAG: Tim44-like domain-containing protein [Burkholderiaceae bacterium]